MIRYLLIFAFLSSAVFARDDGRYSQTNPGIKDWIKGLKNKDGVGCCDQSDGFPAEVEYDTQLDKYRVRIEGVWYIVPDHAVLSIGNRLGYAVVWYTQTYANGVPAPPIIYCFLPAGGT